MRGYFSESLDGGEESVFSLQVPPFRILLLGSKTLLHSRSRKATDDSQTSRNSWAEGQSCEEHGEGWGPLVEAGIGLGGFVCSYEMRVPWLPVLKKP